MRILRLSNSNDLGPQARDGSRSPDFAELLLSRLLGEPVESTIRSAWPSATLPDAVDRMLDHYQPDVVVLVVNPFAFNYESVPLKIQRTFGPLGRPFARLGLAAGSHPRLGPSRLGRFTRRIMRRVIGGATYLEPAEVIESITSTMARTVSREGTALIVAGPVSATVGPDSIDPARGEARRVEVDSALREACARAHVHYFGADTAVTAREADPFRHRDQFHGNLVSHVLAGLGSAQMIICALEELQPRGFTVSHVRTLFDELRATEGSPLYGLLSEEEVELVPRMAGRTVFLSPAHGRVQLG